MKRGATSCGFRAGSPLGEGAAGLRLEVRAGWSVPVDLVVPPGMRTAGGPGRVAKDHGSKLVFHDGGSGPRPGVRSAVVRLRPDGTARLVVRAPRGFPPLGYRYDVPPLRLGVAFAETLEACGELRFQGTCRSMRAGEGFKIVCR